MKSAWAKIVEANLDAEAKRTFSGTFFETLKAMPEPGEVDQVMAKIDADGDGKVSVLGGCSPAGDASLRSLRLTLHPSSPRQVSLDDYWTYVFGISPSRTREAAEAEYEAEMLRWSQGDLDELARMQRRLLAALRGG